MLLVEEPPIEPPPSAPPEATSARSAGADRVVRSPADDPLRPWRWGFLLLGTGLLVQTVIALVVTPSNPDPDPSLDRLDLRLADVLVTAGINLLTVLPATLLLAVRIPHGRWRRYVGILLLARGVELIAIGLTFLFGPPWDAAGSIAVRLVIHLQLVLGMVEIWGQTVLVGEFAIRRRAADLLEQAGQLGWLVLLTLVTTAALSAWSLPRHFPPYLTDDFTRMLLGLAILGRLACQIWLFALLTLSATLARRAAEGASATEAA